MDAHKHTALTIQAAAITFALADDLPTLTDAARDHKEEALNALAKAIKALRSIPPPA